MDSERAQITVTDDGVYEESQQVTVSIVSVEPSSAAIIGHPNSNTFTVMDKNGVFKENVIHST